MNDNLSIAIEDMAVKRLEPSCPDQWAPSLQEGYMKARSYAGGQTVNKESEQMTSGELQESPAGGTHTFWVFGHDFLPGATWGSPKAKVHLCDSEERSSQERCRSGSFKSLTHKRQAPFPGSCGWGEGPRICPHSTCQPGCSLRTARLHLCILALAGCMVLGWHPGKSLMM